MDGWPTEPDKQRNRIGRMNIKIDWLQINLRHCKAAKYNLHKILDEEETDMVCIQEPYTIGCKVMGIPRTYSVYATGAGRKRAAILIRNKCCVINIMISQPTKRYEQQHKKQSTLLTIKS